MHDWEKLRQAQQAQQEQMLRQANPSMQFNPNISNPEMPIKQEETKKSDFVEKQHPDVPDTPSDNPKFNFVLNQNELNKDN